MESKIYKDLTDHNKFSIRFLQEEKELFNPKKLIHAIAFMLIGVTAILFLYGCMKFLQLFNR